MLRFASILSWAVATAVAGCSSQQPLQTTAPVEVVQVPAASPPVTMSTPANSVNSIPASSVLSTGNVPLPPNYGLPFVDPLQDFSDTQIQIVDPEGQVAQEARPQDQQPAYAQTLPQAIVVADTAPASGEVAGGMMPVYTPEYAPAYVPQYEPQYGPQVIVVEAPPQYIIQPEYIPYPVYEPVFFFAAHFSTDCGIEVCRPVAVNSTGTMLEQPSPTSA